MRGRPCARSVPLRERSLEPGHALMGGENLGTEEVPVLAELRRREGLGGMDSVCAGRAGGKEQFISLWSKWSVRHY